jgi:predicted MFS family arabinose efflux permease
MVIYVRGEGDRVKECARGRVITASAFVMLGLYAFVGTAFSPLMPTLMSDFGITSARAGLISVMQNTGGLILAVPAIFFADRIRKGWLLWWAGGLMAAGTLGMGALGFDGFGFFLAIAFLFGMGSRLVDSISAAYLADTYPGRTAVWVARSHVAYASVALLTPWIVLGITRLGLSWQWNFLLAGFVALAVLAAHRWALAGTKTHADSASEKFSPRDVLAVMRSPEVLAAAALIFFQAIGFIGYTTWGPTYLQLERMVNQGFAGMSITLFFIGNIVGKLMLQFFARRFSTRTMLTASPLVMGLAIALGVLLGSPIAFVLLSAAAGMAMAMNVPFSIELATRGRPDKSGAISSFLFIMAFLGSSAGGWLTGVVADWAGYSAALLAVSAGACLLALVSALLMGRPKPRP